ncbi:MAG: hypothetical protein DI538_06150 [Azospira oryzae]|nr:MAG: hypothetical protein DI538_06150 [Azospira oryzae]
MDKRITRPLSETTKKITPKQAVEILKKNGMSVDIEDAEKILKFLRTMANIAVSNHLTQNTENSEKRIIK